MAWLQTVAEREWAALGEEEAGWTGFRGPYLVAAVDGGDGGDGESVAGEVPVSVLARAGLPPTLADDDGS